jgi:hypothetical protein
VRGRSWVRFGGLALGVLLAVGLTTAPAQAAARPTTRISINHTSIRIGGSAVISGSVSPNLHGRTVWLQKHSSSGWHSVSHRTLTSRSRYSFTLRPKHTGRSTYRVVLPKAQSRPRSVSRSVTLTVRPKPAANCTAGYRPCIAPGSDVDCAGGSGNGPRYVRGPVYVTGSDPYDLDRDGDGVACET